MAANKELQIQKIGVVSFNLGIMIKRASEVIETVSRRISICVQCKNPAEERIQPGRYLVKILN